MKSLKNTIIVLVCTCLFSCKGQRINYFLSNDQKGYYAIVYGVNGVPTAKNDKNDYDLKFGSQRILLVSDAIVFGQVDPHYYIKNSVGGIKEIPRDSITLRHTLEQTKKGDTKSCLYKYEILLYGSYDANSSHKQMFEMENSVASTLDSLCAAR